VEVLVDAKLNMMKQESSKRAGEDFLQGHIVTGKRVMASS